MMFADLVDFEDLAGQLKGLGVEISSTAEPAAINAAVADWLDSASAEQLDQAQRQLREFQAASEGLILPAAKESLEAILSELASR